MKRLKKINGADIYVEENTTPETQWGVIDPGIIDFSEEHGPPKAPHQDTGEVLGCIIMLLLMSPFIYAYGKAFLRWIFG